MKKNTRAFTLIELLIVIAIIAIIAGIIFVALNPLKRFQDSRDSKRAADIEAILSAIKTNQVDSGGFYIAEVDAMNNGDVYMIGTNTSGCAQTCTTNVTSNTHCVDLTLLADDGYFGKVPISPEGTGSWSSGVTGYTLTKASSDIITARACESEGTGEITMSR